LPDTERFASYGQLFHKRYTWVAVWQLLMPEDRKISVRMMLKWLIVMGSKEEDNVVE
jgi:hypothetical protein